MMPHTNTDLLKHLPEKYRPLTAHERCAIKSRRAQERIMWLNALSVIRRIFSRLGQQTDKKTATAKVR